MVEFAIINETIHSTVVTRSNFAKSDLTILIKKNGCRLCVSFH